MLMREQDASRSTGKRRKPLPCKGLRSWPRSRRACCNFLRLTGLEPAECGPGPARRELFSAVLEHLAGDESLLLVFAASRAIAPGKHRPRLALLAGHRAHDRGRRKRPRCAWASTSAAPRSPAWRSARAGGRWPSIACRRRATTTPPPSRAIGEMVRALEQTRGRHAAASASACPARCRRRAGCVQNANSTWLNGQPFAARSRGAPRPPGAPRQRRQLLCPLGGRGRRRRRRALGVRRDPRHRLRRRPGASTAR